MATKKKLLQAAAGTAAASGGAGGLNVEQVFSTYLYEGNGSFQAIGNGIKLGQSGDGGSVLLDAEQNNYLRPSSNSGFALGTGAFTIEAFYFHRGSTGDLGPQFFDWDGTSSQLWFGFYGTTLYLRTASNSDLTASLNQQVQTWTHVAAVRDSSGNMSLYHNGTRVASGTGFNATNVTGTQPYIGNNAAGGTTSYTDGFLSNIRISNTARYSGASLTVPTSGFTSDSDTVLLTAQGDSPLTDNSSNALSITTNGDVTASTFGPFDAADAGEGGLVWIKSRTSATTAFIYDTERGATKSLTPSETGAQETDVNTLTSFNSNGFSVGSSGKVNNSINDYASWTFRKAPKFFTCLTYTGTGSAQTISHDLGTTVGTIIVKRTDSAGNWRVFHRSLGATQALTLSSTAAAGTSSSYWNNTAPTDTQFTVGTDLSDSGASFVAYLFAHNNGDGEFGPTGDQDVIRCGSYTGNGLSTGPEIDLGFEPQWVMIKNATTVRDWHVFDVMRGLPTGGNDTILKPNLSDAEISVERLSVTPTGFNLSTTHNSVNGSGDTYIYIAIRRGPMAVPESATDVFNVSYFGQTSGYGGYLGAPVDMALRRSSISGAADWQIASRLTKNILYTNLTNSEVTGDSRFENMKGVYTTTGTNTDQYFWMWQRRPSYFDVVAYTGDSVSGSAKSHNLGVAPEMIWVKNRNNANDWNVWHSALSATQSLRLNLTNAVENNSWFTTLPTDQYFYPNNYQGINQSGYNYIAYLFASLDGVSKVGSITGNGSDQTIDCGFSNGARFVLIKRTSSTSNWWLFDTERGIAVGSDPILRLDITDAEGSSDIIDPHSSGFTINSTFAASGVELIFYAIA